ncbi:MAG: alpha/beta hydrolase [Anaerolineae bacterium]|nr:alpha/beta hydrolase [Anaerolineae bacterium]
MRIWWIIVSISVLALSASVVGAQTSALSESTEWVPQFIEQDCALSAPYSYDMTCGVLRVPENRSNPKSHIIELAVAIIKTRTRSPHPDPIVYLVGGPGGSIVRSVSDFFSLNMINFGRQRDVIFFDQRGTGLSQPRLQCEGVINVALNALTEGYSAERELRRSQYASMLCSQQYLEMDVDISAYTTANSAADLNDLRLALGYDSWNLFGVSYGTRLALTAMRDYPEGIRSVVLDSVYPAQVNLFTDYLDNATRALDVLFAGCAANQTCSTDYPNLEATFVQLYNQLNADPQTVQLSSYTGDDVSIVLSGDKLFDWVFSWLYNIENIENIPRWLSEIAAGDYDSAVRAGLRQELRVYNIDHGMYQAVQCHDEISFTTEADFTHMRDAYPQYASLLSRMLMLNERVLDVCRDWQPNPTDAIENDPIVSDIPTLLLSGEYDPITPPAWGQLAAETLSHSYFYEVPGVGHAVIFSSLCGRQIAADFIDNPDRSPAHRCLQSAHPPEFARARN